MPVIVIDTGFHRMISTELLHGAICFSGIALKIRGEMGRLTGMKERRQNLGARRAVRPDGPRAQRAPPRSGGRAQPQLRPRGRSPPRAWGSKPGGAGRRRGGATAKRERRPGDRREHSGRCRPPARAHGSLCTGAGSLPHTHRITLSPESESRHGLMAVTMIGFRVVRECACAVHGRSVMS